MNLNNIRLIFVREMRDQLRDRRTLFLIAVLPLLLYPLLGMSFFQLSQFLRHHAAKVVVVGGEELAGHTWLPPLMEGGQFSSTLFGNAEEQASLELISSTDANPAGHEGNAEQTTLESAEQALSRGEVQVVLYFPSGFGDRLVEVRESLIQRVEGSTESAEDAELLKPQMLFNSANEKSRIAQLRVERVLRNWRTAVMQTNLRDSHVPLNAAQPFELQPQDVAQEHQRHAAVWSKILPFILFVWALTGAFYPAVDLCAGEKERGTLETLLVSPAQRREIVWGKLLTIMSFSVMTALLNLGSMGLTANFVLAQFRDLGAFGGQGVLSLPPFSAIVWLPIALIPISALFSALCLACAAFARSTKEGQYYLMPLLLVIMPLMMLPLSPGVELNLGNSLIPVTGVVLLLRSVIEGQYWEALKFIVPVVGVTFACCLLAIRWAEEQFNSESVLFRESERLDLGRWLVHLVRDRTDTPTFAQGVLCVAVILVIQFFVKLAMSTAAVHGIDYAFFRQAIFISQVVCIAFPTMILALLFTRSPWKTLLLDRLPTWQMLVAAALLAVFIRPLGMEFATAIQHLYPPSAEMLTQMETMSKAIDIVPNWWSLMLLMAVLPAVCEEIAFRGFVLSGLRHIGHKWWAIGLSAIAFGVVHPILQQQIAAAAVGVALGYLAIQTGNLLPCMLFHAIYNGLGISVGKLAEETGETAVQSQFGWLLGGSEITIFQPWVLLVSVLGTALVLWWLHRLPYQHTKEEQLHEAREQQYAGA
ncbi:MAG: CPBP family intramembrane metalloprotease [Planctomycetales bacterium]|nr:CPBP family intramembrane metalloprotease [Planctomycetales bacterium]